jgi:hypothetical protein
MLIKMETTESFSQSADGLVELHDLFFHELKEEQQKKEYGYGEILEKNGGGVARKLHEN